MANIPLQANGNIHVSAFIKMDTTDNLAIEAGATDKTIGISSESTREAPIGTNSIYAAIAGDQFEWFQEGETCFLTAGGTINPGDRLKPTTNGAGVATTTDKDWYGAVAVTGGATGEAVRVIVQGGFISA